MKTALAFSLLQSARSKSIDVNNNNRQLNHYDVIKGLERDDRGYYSAKIWGFLLALRDANEMLLLHPAVTSKVHLVMM